MQIVIDIDENIFTRLFDNGTEDYAIVNDDLFAVAKSIRNGTPLETQRQKGKWITCKSRFGVEYFKCSECGRRLDWIDRDDNYCNNCGSDNSESTKEWFKKWDTTLAEMSGGEEE